MSKFASAHST